MQAERCCADTRAEHASGPKTTGKSGRCRPANLAYGKGPVKAAGIGRPSASARQTARLAERAAAGRPRSVMKAVTSSAGVTSKAGFQAATPAGAVAQPAEGQDLAGGSRSSMTMPSPSRVAGSKVERRRRHVERHAVAVGQHGQRVGADLVRRVAVGGDAVGAGDHGVDPAAAQQAARPPRRRSPSPRCPGRPAPRRSGARPAAAAASRRRTRARACRPRARRRPRRGPCRSRRWPGRRRCSGSARSRRPAAGRPRRGPARGPSAMSSAWTAPGLGEQRLGHRAPAPPAASAPGAQRASRSSAQNRFTAVGRVAARCRRACVQPRERRRRRPARADRLPPGQRQSVGRRDADRRRAAHRQLADGLAQLGDGRGSPGTPSRPAAGSGPARTHAPSRHGTTGKGKGRRSWLVRAASCARAPQHLRQSSCPSRASGRPITLK